MSIGCILALGVSALGPVALAVACVFEFMARKLRKNPRSDKKLLEKRQQVSDAGLVIGMGLWCLSYVIQSMSPDRAVWEALFQQWMTWVVIALVVLDVIYVVLRRGRPRKPGKKKQFWEL